MKHKDITYILMFVITLFSCDLMDDIDNIKPEYQLEEDNYVVDAQSAEQALRGVYQGWRSWGISTIRLHMSVLAGSVRTTGSISGIEGFSTNSVTAENKAIVDLYSALYANINAANYLIEALGNNQAVGLDSVRQEEIIAECKFHRALSHFMLLRHFGEFYDVNSRYGIVLRKEPYRPASPLSARARVADCYTFILQDLTDATKSCPENVTSHAYISRLTAKAMKSRVLLSKGDYIQAASLSKEVIDEAEEYGYVLELNDWSNIFYNTYLSSEILFAPYTMGFEEMLFIDIARTIHSNYSSQLSKHWAEKSGSLSKDLRYVMTFEPENSATGNGKYPYAIGIDGIGNGYIFMRLAEVYLIHAEAEVRQGISHYENARKSLKVIMDRAGYPEDFINSIPDAELLLAIREHKWLELMAENSEEWFDLVRYTINGDLKSESVKPELLAKWQLILPIPQKAMAGNKLLEQNPNY